MQEKYEEAIPYFISAVPSDVLDYLQVLKWKSMSDRFKKLKTNIK